MVSYNNLIVFDIGTAAFLKNRILDPDYAINFPGASLIPCLAELANQYGWSMVTADVFNEQKPSFKRAVCLSHEITPLLFNLFNAGVELKVLTSGESPNVTWSFYHNLNRYSRLFKHTYVFRGFASRVHPTSEFHEYYWPNAYRSMKEGNPWGYRRLLGMVSSCKARVNINRHKLTSRLISLLRKLRIHAYQIIDEMLRFQDLYELRLKIIEKFAKESEFYLYGKGWIEAKRSWSRIGRINFAHSPIECRDKVEILSDFKFALCFENCTYPGYLTEKIFDAFFAGAVPVYMGAPDVTDFIPSSCFVDFRNFSTFEALWNFLNSVTHEEWQMYRAEINKFLSSEKYLNFTQEVVARKLYTWLTD